MSTGVVPLDPLLIRVKAIAKRALAKTHHKASHDHRLLYPPPEVLDEIDSAHYSAERPCDRIKIDIQSLEHPFFSLSKKKDIKVRKFLYNVQDKREEKTIIIEIIPPVIGRATIYDKDILTYCASQLTQALNNGEPVSRRVRFSGYRYLIDTRRVKGHQNIGGGDYDAVESQLKRLYGTSVSTNIPSNGKIYTESFKLIENYRIIRDETTKKMIVIEVVLASYFYNAVVNRQVLTQSPLYYEIKHPLTKRLYEIARKHCGKQLREIAFTYQQLHHKTGSTASFNEFMRMIRRVIKNENIPEYRIRESECEGKFVLFRKEG